jgi:tetratricopeptide (TPR) repeat protein
MNAMKKGNTIINFDSHQKEKLSQILGRYLSKTSWGKKIISQFRNNKVQGAEALLAYLDRTLPKDINLTNQIANILEERHREQFITIVNTGSSVKDIFNIGQLGELNIRYYVFSDTKQVITLLLGLVVIGSIIAFGRWWSQQPWIMTGDFNIAVAEFVAKGDAHKIAPIASQRIFSFLDGQYVLSSFQKVQVQHEKIGVISSAEDARAMAKKINAHLVIYGDVTVLNDRVLVTSQFYVAGTHQADVAEVNGEHKLAAPITLIIKDLINPTSKALKIMEQNTRTLTEFTKALVYLEARKPSDLILARDSIIKAITEAERYADFPGKEVLYLFASDIVRRQGHLEEAQQYITEAMRLNKNYGRGYIAQANIYYDQGNYYLASKLYKQAAELGNPPLGAYIQEKASIGLGNICLVQFQYVQQYEMNTTAIPTLANCALENYQVVVRSYNQQSNREEVLAELAAGAYYSSGIIYQSAGQVEAARLVYRQALMLTEDLGLQKQIQRALDQVEEQ